MAYDPVPKCPKCGGTDLKLVSEKRRWSGPSRTAPINTLSVYGCTCGTGFTHMLKHEPAKTLDKTA